MIATMLDQFKAAAMKRGDGRFTRRTFLQFRRALSRLKAGDLAGAEVMASRDLETRAMWLDALDAQRQIQALISADLSTMVER